MSNKKVIQIIKIRMKPITSLGHLKDRGPSLLSLIPLLTYLRLHQSVNPDFPALCSEFLREIKEISGLIEPRLGGFHSHP